MSERINRQWTVAEHPTGVLEERHFAYREAPIPEPGPGEVLLETHALNLAPVMRMYMMRDGAAGEAPLSIGDVIHGRGVARVVQSRHPDWSPGDFLQAQLGWQTHKVSALTPKEKVRRLPARGIPVHYALAVLGMTGFSAYCGLVLRGGLAAGDRVLVSGAAGGVGSLVVQIARALGAQPVVGIAGSAAKCELVQSLGAHAGINYRRDDVSATIGQQFPDGFDLYFDNVGGEILEAALEHLAPAARVVLCGSISEYQRDAPFGPKNYTNLRAAEADLRGFFVYNYSAQFDEAEIALADWLAEGTITPVIDELIGFERMPEALMGLYAGTDGGKRIVRLFDGPAAIC